jgi:hypothetical protein
MAFTFTTSGAAIKAAGANVNSTIVLDVTQLEDWSDKIENEICAVARYDCITNYASLTANGKQILGQIEDAKLAQFIINYEPEAISTIGATIRLNFLQNQVSQGFSKIDDGKIKKYLTIPS